jgi:hypothetical protein
MSQNKVPCCVMLEKESRKLFADCFGDVLMRGRKPSSVVIAPADLPLLEQMANSLTSPWYKVRRARIVLALSRATPVQTIAFQMRCDRKTVRRTGLLYQQQGLAGLFADIRRSGRSQEISPPTKSTDRPTGVSGADSLRVAHHPLVQ